MVNLKSLARKHHRDIFLKKKMLDLTQDATSRLICGDHFKRHEYSVERLIGMIYMYPCFKFPTNKKRLAKEKEKSQGQNICMGSIYKENWPMSVHIVTCLNELEKRDLLTVTTTARYTEIRLKNELLDLHHMMVGVLDLQMEVEVLKVVSSFEDKNPIWVEYEDTEPTEKLKKPIEVYNRITPKLQINDGKAMTIPKACIHFNSTEFNENNSSMKVHGYEKRGKYFFNGNKLKLIKMGPCDAVNTFSKIYNVESMRLDKINSYRHRINDSNYIKYASYAVFRIPFLFTKDGIYTNAEGENVINGDHPAQMGVKEWWKEDLRNE